MNLRLCLGVETLPQHKAESTQLGVESKPMVAEAIAASWRAGAACHVDVESVIPASAGARIDQGWNRTRSTPMPAASRQVEALCQRPAHTGSGPTAGDGRRNSQRLRPIDVRDADSCRGRLFVPPTRLHAIALERPAWWAEAWKAQHLIPRRVRVMARRDRDRSVLPGAWCTNGSRSLVASRRAGGSAVDPAGWRATLGADR